MSKAFTRESDEANSDEITPVRPQAAVGVRRYITREGVDHLREQATALIEKKRDLMGAGSRGSGDAPARVRQVEAAIQRIQEVLSSVTVAEPPADRRKVAFGAFVQVRDQSGEQETYQIVGEDEADPNQGRISAISPLARALANHSAGVTVRFRSPAGEQEITIVSVHYRC